MLKFDHQGFVPAVIQDDASGEVLMVAFMNQEAWQLTCETGYTHFFSRSRHTIWRKGEQSGNVQEVRDVMFYGAKLAIEPTYEKTYDLRAAKKLDNQVLVGMKEL